jgi:hypothetical protein
MNRAAVTGRLASPETLHHLSGGTMDDAQLLDFLINSLDDATRDDGFGWSNQIVRVEEVGDKGFELGLLPLEDHPASYLLGFTAPASWRVLGIAGCAWAGPLAEPGEQQVRPSAHPDAIRVRMIALTARSGARAGRLRPSSGEVSDTGPAGGLLDDCLSRAFGLPTPPPPAPPHELMAIRWLEDVLAGSAAALPESLPSRCGWEAVRRRLIGGEWNDDYRLTPDDAAWMDDGMLARWVLGEHAPLPRLLAQLDTVVGATAARWARAEVTRVLKAA